MRTALAAVTLLLLVSTGYASIAFGHGKASEMSSRGAVHFDLFSQVVSRADSLCVASDEFETCSKACGAHTAQAECREESGGKCSKTVVPCGVSNCCSETMTSGSSVRTTICSKTCCFGTDENGNGISVNSCLSSSSGSNSTSTSPGASPAAASGTKAGSKSSSCFPSHATVELESGARLRMDELRVGDRVRVSKDAFSDVFLFTHKVERAAARFVVIHMASGHTVSMTSGHYIYANDATLVPAASVQVGDELTLASGAHSAVVSVSHAVHAGVYNPQTLHGDIVVDGIVTSTYTTAVSPVLGHASLSPLRALYSALGLTTGLLNGGAEHAVRVLPGGVHSY
jgi:Hint module